MKKRTSLLVSLLATFALLGGAVSCAPRDSGTTTPTSSTIEDDEEYVVKFNDNYSGKSVKVVVEAGKKVTLPENPTRPGFLFVGWFLDYRGQNKFDESLPITQDMTVYAKWEVNISEHTVTFHYMDNVTPDVVVTVNHGSAVVRPADPEYPDGTMAFTGWFTNSDRTKIYDFSLAVNDNLELYAGWKLSKATVTFNYNYTGAPESVTVTAEIDQPIAKPSDPTRDHYGFNGWFTRSVGGDLFDFTTPITGDLTLFAQWEENEFLVTFDVNGATIDKSVATTTYIAKDASASEFATDLEGKMTYVGHDFKGWYSEKLDPDSDEDATAGKTPASLTITNATTLYAGWALHTYTVSFDLGYQGGTTPASQSVKYGKTATEPTLDDRENYLFGGWFTDEDLTDQFTFDMPVVSDLTLHAKWIEQSIQHDPIKVKYYIGTTLFAEKEIEYNASASTNAPNTPTKTNAIFGGWYREATFVNKFNMNANLTADTSVYGKFLDRKRFEAEACDLTEKPGKGTSTELFEDQLICDYKYVTNGETNVSNGYFVRALYYNGASLDFIVESDRDVTDAVLSLRVSSESYEFFTTKEYNGVVNNYLSETEFKIAINSEWDGNGPTDYLKYGGLYMPMANTQDIGDADYNKTPFEDRIITTTLSLQKGGNSISFFVANNNNHGGTFGAEAPTIDCFDIYTDAELYMEDFEFYNRENVQRG